MVEEHDLVTCTVHGKQRPAYVCCHILLQLRDRVPRGAIWSYNVEDESFTMYCNECELLVAGDGPEISDEHASQMDVRLICESCMDVVIALNGKTRLN